jgi:predicted metal-dependent phosphoesterase TrpH
LPPDEVARRAVEAGVEILALTDHDTTAGAHCVTSSFPSRSLRAVELTCHHKGKTVHLLVYDMGSANWSVLEATLQVACHARIDRLRAMGERLARLGAAVDVESILAAANGRSVGRPDLAAALLRAGHVTSLDEAFRRYLNDRGPANIPITQLSVADALERTSGAGARVSLAHPHTIDAAYAILREHRGRGLEGVEAFYGPYDAATRNDWLALAASEGLVATGGSDFHGSSMPGVTGLGVDIPSPYAERLLEWLSP